MASGIHTLPLAWDQPNGRGNLFGVSASKPLPLSLFGEVEEEEENQVAETAEVRANGREEDGEDEFGEFEYVGTDQSGNDVGGEAEVVDIVGFGSFEDAGKVDRPGVDLDGFGNFGKAQSVNGDAVEVNDFGNFEKASRVNEVGDDVDSKVNGFQSAEENGWEFSTTSQWMLTMHGIHSGAKSRKDEILVPSYSNGRKASPGVPKLTPPKAPEDDEWGEFAEPALTKEAEPDMIDLISMSEEGPAEQTFLSSTVDAGSDLLNSDTRITDGQSASADSGAFDLLSTSHTREVKADGGEDFFGLHFQEDGSCKDASSTKAQASAVEFDLLFSVEQPAEVSGTGTVQEDLFGLNFSQNASCITSTEDAQIPTDDSLKMTSENGFVDDSWGFGVLNTKADALSRSASLPATDADGVKPAAHRRSQSNGTFISDFPLIEEWSLEPTSASLASPDLFFEGTSQHDEKKTELNLADTLLGMDGVKDEKPASNGFVDLLDLDWQYNNSADLAEEPRAGVELETATKADPTTTYKHLETWTALSRVCASELEQGAQIWNEATAAQCASELVSALQGENYFKALIQVYRVYLILRSALQLHSSWLKVSPDHSAELKLCMDRAREAWTGLKNVLELLGLQEPIYSETLVQQEEETPICAFTLLPLQSIPDVPSTLWNGNSCFLPVANLWANRISRLPPFDV